MRLARWCNCFDSISNKFQLDLSEPLLVSFNTSRIKSVDVQISSACLSNVRSRLNESVHNFAKSIDRTDHSVKSLAHCLRLRYAVNIDIIIIILLFRKSRTLWLLRLYKI